MYYLIIGVCVLVLGFSRFNKIKVNKVETIKDDTLVISNNTQIGYGNVIRVSGNCVVKNNTQHGTNNRIHAANIDVIDMNQIGNNNKNS